MAVNDRTDLGQIATVPDNLSQPPVFGAISELVKDAILLELRHFLSTRYDGMRKTELPRIDKYSVAVDTVVDPLETAVNLVRSYPDVTEDLPLIAVMATTGRNLKLGLSDKFVSYIVPAAKVVGTTSGPFILSDGMTLVFTTQPDGVETNVVTSTMVFKEFMFSDITAATLAEVIYAINFQALYVTAYQAGSPTHTLGIRAGGQQGTQFPNKITITGGTAAAALGFTVNQTDQNYGVGKLAYQRHHLAADLTIALEVVAESENIRTDVSDLLYDFMSYIMADRKYQLFGRSVFDDSVDNEYYQIIIKDNDIQFSGEQEMPRQGDNRDKLYINRIMLPVTAIQYSDRICTSSSGTSIAPAINVTLIEDSDIPAPS